MKPLCKTILSSLLLIIFLGSQPTFAAGWHLISWDVGFEGTRGDGTATWIPSINTASVSARGGTTSYTSQGLVIRSYGIHNIKDYKHFAILYDFTVVSNPGSGSPLCKAEYDYTRPHGTGRNTQTFLLGGTHSGSREDYIWDVDGKKGLDLNFVCNSNASDALILANFKNVKVFGWLE